MQRQKSFKPRHGLENGKKFDSRSHWKILYDKEWNKYSHKFLSINQSCYSCGAKATVVDHVKAHKGDVDLFWKLDNMIGLCEKCHNTITARFDMRPTEETYQMKLKWIANNRVRNGITSRSVVVPID